MAIVINGSGTVTGISVGGLPDGIVDSGTLATNSVDSAELIDGSIDNSHLADDAVGLAEMASGTDGNIISYDASGNPVAIATGDDGQVLTSAGAGAQPAFEDAPAGGLTECDQWRITSNLAGGADTTVWFTANWERTDTYGFGKLGTGMSESSGVFTFPSTGYWLITFNMRYGGSTADARYIWSKINTTTDSGSNYYNAAISYGNVNPGSSYWYGVNECKFLFDVTNTSTHKVKFSASTIVNDYSFYGNTDTNETYATWIKLGDT